MESSGLQYLINVPFDSTDLQFVDPGPSLSQVPEENCPVIFLFGWLGCNDKNLLRYSEIYDRRGCITIRCSLPPRAFLFSQLQYPNMACGLLDLLRERNWLGNPMFFHVFSNVGCFVYQYVINESHLQKLSLDIRGCIFDSAPGRKSASSFIRALMAMPVGIKPVRFVLALIACFWIYLLCIMLNFLNTFVSRRYLHADMFLHLKHLPASCPKHFIYSADDAIVPSKDTEEFLEHRAAMGELISRCKFDSSPHVTHLKAHPEEYVQSVNSFLQKCLNPDQSGKS